MRTAFTLLVAIILGGCATVPWSVSSEATRHIKRIAVVSVAAQELTRLHVGVTVFGNEGEKKSIANWQADKVFEDQLGQAAERVLEATLVKAPYNLTEFLPVNDPASFGDPSWEKIEAATKKLCEAHHLDAVLVVAKRRVSDIFGGTNQTVVGAGVYTRHGISLLHLASVVSLLDCRTGKELVTRGLTRSTQQPDGKIRYSIPNKDLPEEISRKPMSQWTQDVEARVRNDLLTLSKPAWDDTLREMIRPR